jgi:hypothetical protein
MPSRSTSATASAKTSSLTLQGAGSLHDRAQHRFHLDLQCRLRVLQAEGFRRAFDLLEKSLLNASDWIKAWIRFDSDLDPLRELPRYEKIRALIEQA